MRIIVPTAPSLKEGGQNIPAMLVWPASAVSAGIIAASITFTTMSRASEVTVNASSIATRAVGFLAGRGIHMVFGPISGLIAEQTTREIGDEVFTPAIRTGTRHTTYIASAAVGIATIALSTVLIHSGSWLYHKGHNVITRYLTQPPSEVVTTISDIENDIVLLSVVKPEKELELELELEPQIV